MSNFRLAGCIAASITLASCATVVRGTTEDVVINYQPADAKVVTSLNHTCSSSPCTVNVPRKKEFSVTVSKPGFETKTVQVGTKVSGKGAAGVAGNVLLGGVVGVGVDVATGASRDHFPNPVNVELVPKGTSKAVEPKLSPAKKPGKRDTPTS